MKYIIDVPDEAVSFMDGEMSFFVEPKIKDERRRHYVLRMGEENVSIYTEPDREDIEDEVWDFAKKMVSTSGNEMSDIWGYATNFGEVMHNTTYSEAKAKYDAWKQEKEEVHVGDEVQYSLAGYEYTFIVFGKENDTLYGIRSDCKDGLDDIYDGWESCYKLDNTLRKTGRHFDEVERLLERMKAE